jgi:uncharacterized protein
LNLAICYWYAYATSDFPFYAERSDFLPPERRRIALPHVFLLTGSTKYMIESLAVPHTEIGLILVHATPVELTRLVQDGDCVSRPLSI